MCIFVFDFAFCIFFIFFFFFQAEDGIRDPLVTGVQTCALPIFHGPYLRYLLIGVKLLNCLAQTGHNINASNRAYDPRRRTIEHFSPLCSRNVHGRWRKPREEFALYVANNADYFSWRRILEDIPASKLPNDDLLSYCFCAPPPALSERFVD